MNIDLPDWSEPLFSHHRYKSLRGGRGGGKSWVAAQALLLQAAERPLRVLCARELQVSIQDSVHKLLAERIDAMGLSSFYDVQQAGIRGRNGAEFLFSGVRSNVTKIKSMEGIDRLWLEEAQSVSEASWSVLIPTIRKEGSEIWLTWNPDLDTDATWKRFIVLPPPDCLSIEVGWADNKWLSPELLAEKNYAYKIDAESASHVWGGQTRRNSQACVLRGRYTVESFTPGAEWNGPYLGLDFGYSVDPSALVKCWINERKLYIEHEAYGVGVDIDDLPALLDRVPTAKEHTIRADNSRPETIAHLRRHGYPRVLPCVKGQGSVEDGVEHLRSYEQIVIHPRCTHFVDEARLWSWKVDRLSGDIMPVLASGWDHLMDATRYALEPIIRAGKPRKPTPKEPWKPHDYNVKPKIRENAWKGV